LRGEDVEQGGLSGAIGAEQAEDFPLFYREAHVIECPRLPLVKKPRVEDLAHMLDDDRIIPG
jgi:hypothetical protein